MTEHEKGQWAAFNRVLHWINEQESREIKKGDLYDAVMEMRPAQPVREGQEGKAELRRCALSAMYHFADVARRQPRSHVTSAEYEAADQAAVDAICALASQPDPAAEIARLTKERDEAVKQADNVVLSMLWLPGVRAVLDGLPDDDSVRPYLKMQDETIARAERAESENAGLREALEPFAKAGDMALISGRPPGEHVDANAFLRASAALANTADRGQEEKGNG